MGGACSDLGPGPPQQLDAYVRLTQPPQGANSPRGTGIYTRRPSALAESVDVTVTNEATSTLHRFMEVSRSISELKAAQVEARLHQASRDLAKYNGAVEASVRAVLQVEHQVERHTQQLHDVQFPPFERRNALRPQDLLANLDAARRILSDDDRVLNERRLSLEVHCMKRTDVQSLVQRLTKQVKLLKELQREEWSLLDHLFDGYSPSSTGWRQSQRQQSEVGGLGSQLPVSKPLLQAYEAYRARFTMAHDLLREALPTMVQILQELSTAMQSCSFDIASGRRSSYYVSGEDFVPPPTDPALPSKLLRHAVSEMRLAAEVAIKAKRLCPAIPHPLHGEVLNKLLNCQVQLDSSYSVRPWWNTTSQQLGVSADDARRIGSDLMAGPAEASGYLIQHRLLTAVAKEASFAAKWLHDVLAELSKDHAALISQVEARSTALRTAGSASISASASGSASPSNSKPGTAINPDSRSNVATAIGSNHKHNHSAGQQSQDQQQQHQGVTHNLSNLGGQRNGLGSARATTADRAYAYPSSMHPGASPVRTGEPHKAGTPPTRAWGSIVLTEEQILGAGSPRR